MCIERKHILVVDDSDDIRNLLSDILKDAGAEVTQCANGKQALDHIGEAEFDLVVTDILMPEEDGISVIRTLKGSDEKTPVLAISGGNRALASHWLLKITEALEVDAVLHKPIEPDEFLQVVRRLLA